MPDHALKHTTRGGQVVLHNLRMISQVLGKVALWLLPVAVVCSIAWFWLMSDPQSRMLGQAWLSAKVNLLVHGKQHIQPLAFTDGIVLQTYSSQIVQAPFVLTAVAQVRAALAQSVWVGLLAYMLACAGILVWLRRHGDSYTQHKPLKGDALAEIAQVNRLIAANARTSDLHFGVRQLMLPAGSELQHFLIHGTTGCGKSTVIKSLLDHIRRRGERAIVYDKSCNFVSQFYQESQDVLLNPLDTRSADWSLWSECRDKSDFDNVAAALIPSGSNTQDPFWINAARTIFAVAAFRLHAKGDASLASLLRFLFNADLADLQSLVQGTEAESLISEKAEKTALSIKSVLATYLKSLCYLSESTQPFSIRQWVADDAGKSWLFISSLGDKHESLRPLISVWLDIAINALLSLPEKKERRIWIILDELGSLQQLPYLQSGLAEARKFGGCFVVGVQSYAQLSKIYGHEGSREISSMLNTRFLFRIPDPEIALWSAKNLGETTLEEVREGISYGANTTRDGVSMQRSERDKPVVPISEIMRLPDLSCFVRLAGAYPIVQLQMHYVERAVCATAFMPKANTPQVLLPDVERMVATAMGAPSLINTVTPHIPNLENVFSE